MYCIMVTCQAENISLMFGYGVFQGKKAMNYQPENGDYRKAFPFYKYPPVKEPGIESCRREKKIKSLMDGWIRGEEN